MKNWKTWALLFLLFLLVKMCGGCLGCGGSASGPDIGQLKEKVSRETGYAKYEFSISDIEFVHDNPPTYRFKVNGPYGIKHEGRCSLSSQGNVRGVSVD